MKLGRKVFGLAAGLCLAGTLAGCSSGTAASANSGSGSAPKTLQPVSIGLTSYNSLHLWVIFAKDEGLMKPYGISFQPEVFQSVADIVPGVISGSLDFGISTSEGAFAAQNKGGDVKIVALENVDNPYQIVTPASVKSVSGLKGGTIAVDSIGVSADYVTALTLLQRAGLQTSQYHFIDGGAPASRVAGLVSGTVQATLNFPPGTQQLTSKGMKVLLNAANEPYFQGIAISGLLADPAWYQANRTLAVDFMKGYIASVKWMYNPANKAKAISDIASTMSVSQQFATDTYSFFVNQLKAETPNPAINLANLEKEIQNDQGAGVAGLPAPTAAGLKGRYDNSLVDAAHG